MRVLAFDQSARAFAAVVLEANEPSWRYRIIYKETLKPKTDGIYRLEEIEVFFLRVIGTYKPDVIVREEHVQRQYGNAAVLQAINGIIDVTMARSGVQRQGRYAIISPGTWKKFCVGKGNLKKDTSYLIHMNKFFKQTPLLDDSSKMEVLDDNIADAMCLALTAGCAWRELSGLTLPQHYDDKSRDHIRSVAQKCFGVVAE